MELSATELVIQKLKTYQGSLLSTKWKVPKSKRQFAFALNRVLKLFYSMQNRQLFYPELVDAVKQVAIYFKMYIIENRPDKSLYYLTELQNIIDFEPPHTFDRIEQVRIRENKRCAVCRCQLVYPAYLIYRTKESVEVRSQATGIQCLKQLHQYIHSFKESLALEWQLDGIRHEIDEHGREALKAG